MRVGDKVYGHYKLNPGLLLTFIDVNCIECKILTKRHNSSETFCEITKVMIVFMIRNLKLRKSSKIQLETTVGPMLGLSV